VDLLRALQRDGMVRLERDRQGALRVFQGPAWAQSPVDSFPETPVPELVERAEAAGVLAPEESGVYLETAADQPEAEQPTSDVIEGPRPEKKRRSRKAKPATGETQPEKARRPRAAKTARTSTARTRSRKATQQEV
jgi:hypothetical protein